MKYYFVASFYTEDPEQEVYRDIVCANSEEEARSLFSGDETILEVFELKEDSFKNPGFLISDTRYYNPKNKQRDLNLFGYTKLVLETDEKEPETIMELTNSENPFNVKEGYKVYLIPSPE